jgi:glycosyltransferase involved in cell wall biosynthesis
MKPKIEYWGFTGKTGYGIAAINYVFALIEGGYDVWFKPLDLPVNMSKFIGKKSSILEKIINPNHDPERIQIIHSIPELQKRIKKKSKFTIGLATFETTDPPKHWIELYNKNNAVIAPSRFILDEFVKAGITKPIFHIPHCLDFSKYNKDVIPFNKSKRFTFMFIGTWKDRKGYKELIKAWKEEFNNKDNVQLIIKTSSSKEAHCYLEKELGNNWCRYAPIIIDESFIDDDNMPSFIKSADCIVNPHYGEGFSLVGLSAMALGISTIITNYSGPTDYANASTSFLIEPEGFVTYNWLDKLPQFMNKKWAFISVPQLRSIMREVFNNKKLREEKVNKAYQFVHENFGYSQIIEKFNKMFNRFS